MRPNPRYCVARVGTWAVLFPSIMLLVLNLHKAGTAAAPLHTAHDADRAPRAELADSSELLLLLPLLLSRPRCAEPRLR